MKLSRLTLNGSFANQENLTNNGSEKNNQRIFQTPEKNIINKNINKESISTIHRTKSAGPKTFLKTVTKIKNQPAINNNTSVNKFQDEQEKYLISPLSKSCFKKSNRPLLSINQIKRMNGSKSQKDHTKPEIFQPKQIQVKRQDNQFGEIKRNLFGNVESSQKIVSFLNIDTNEQQNCEQKPSINNEAMISTNYKSVKIFMSTKFKKGIKGKVPVNILAFPESICQKQTQTEFTVSEVSYQKLAECVKRSKSKTQKQK